MEKKPWYKSKTIQSDIITGLAVLWNTLAVPHGMPAIPDWVYGILGSIGIYGRTTANTKISS